MEKLAVSNADFGLRLPAPPSVGTGAGRQGMRNIKTLPKNSKDNARRPPTARSSAFGGQARSILLRPACETTEDK